MKCLVFNKITKSLVALIETDHGFTAENDYYLYKEIEFNPETHIWQGDYDTGELVLIDEAPAPIYEAALNDAAMRKIRGKYDYFAQINVIVDVVDELIAGNISTETLANYEAMKAFIAETRAINGRLKDAYQDSPDHEYLSIQQADDEFAKQLEGGIHELLGPRGVANNETV